MQHFLGIGRTGKVFHLFCLFYSASETGIAGRARIAGTVVIDQEKHWTSIPEYSLAKLIVSHDLLCSTVTNQIAFDRRDSSMFPKFERTIHSCCQAMVSKLETVDAITFTLLKRMISVSF